VPVPPAAELGRQAKILREIAGDDPRVVALVDVFEAVDEMINQGWIERRGGGEKTQPVPLPKELRPYAAQWEKEPPEFGEQ
jgi:hypothetical protein